MNFKKEVKIKFFKKMIALTLFTFIGFGLISGQTLHGVWQSENNFGAYAGMTYIFQADGNYSSSVVILETGQIMHTSNGFYSLKSNENKIILSNNGGSFSYDFFWLSASRFKIIIGSNTFYFTKSASSIVVQPKVQPEKCWPCKGNGVCNVCSGSGYLSYTIVGIHPACTSCNASGRCSYCRGTGIFQPKY